MTSSTYTMTEKVWLYPGETANWHFVTLPKTMGREIKEIHKKHTTGFGSLPVVVTIGKTTWNTSIFPDKRAQSYLLPLKAAVRKKEDIEVGDLVRVTLIVRA